jgi:outer membrane receptor protein involved in Fe transport
MASLWRTADMAFLVFLTGVSRADAEASESALEVIVVSAQRTDQNAQDVPIALTALTEQMLEERQVINVSGLHSADGEAGFGGVEGFVDIEAGDYDHQRLKGAVNLQVSDTLAFRVSVL